MQMTAVQTTAGKDAWFGTTFGLREDGGWVDALKQEWTNSSPDLRKRWSDLIALCRDPQPRHSGDWAKAEDDADTQCSYPPWPHDVRGVVPEPGSDAYQNALKRAAPSDGWLNKVAALAQTTDAPGFTTKLAHVLRCAVQSGIGSLNRRAPNREVLQVLIWCVAALPNQEIIDALRQLATWSVENKTAQAKTIGIALACVTSEHAAAALRMIELGAKRPSPRSRFGRYASHVERKIGITAEDSAERFVPNFGLDDRGIRRTDFGDAGAVELRIENSQPVLRYYNGTGKQVAAVPAAIKRDHAEVIQELRVTAKGLGQLFVNQRNRIESIYLAERRWNFRTWQTRYLHHPVIGHVAKRLIWQIDGVAVLFSDDRAENAQGDAVVVSDASEVQLWHPLGRSTEDVLAWRARLESLGITQPFKQAHREVYVVTDAERTTSTYSNRFAAHILRQTQFRVLTVARQWERPFLGGWDSGDSGMATRKLPGQWRAEFWINGAGDEHGPTGGFLHISTDQVRFLSGDNTEPTHLTDVPPLIFSEVMRDVDMFVGVASVGNDPAWADGGPQSRYRDYWQGVSFGELNATAQTRKDVLQRLVPKLKIAGQCSFDEKFLVVKGALRTYKIHLGSGNILMAPNDHYLCIVPKQSDVKTGDFFLPFEGDRTLSVILSKAFLLAADSWITDPAILNQIRGK